MQNNQLLTDYQFLFTFVEISDNSSSNCRACEGKTVQSFLYLLHFSQKIMIFASKINKDKRCLLNTNVWEQNYECNIPY